MHNLLTHKSTKKSILVQYSFIEGVDKIINYSNSYVTLR